MKTDLNSNVYFGLRGQTKLFKLQMPANNFQSVSLSVLSLVKNLKATDILEHGIKQNNLKVGRLNLIEAIEDIGVQGYKILITLSSNKNKDLITNVSLIKRDDPKYLIDERESIARYGTVFQNAQNVSKLVQEVLNSLHYGAL